MRIVWKWKSNILKYIGKPGVYEVRVSVPFKRDNSLQGRDGWVGFYEGNPKAEETEKELTKWWEVEDGRGIDTQGT